MRKTRIWLIAPATMAVAAWLLLNWYYSPQRDCVELGGQWTEASCSFGNQVPLPNRPWFFVD